LPNLENSSEEISISVLLLLPQDFQDEIKNFTARLHVMQRRVNHEKAVGPPDACPSVCLSNACIVTLWQNERNFCPRSYTDDFRWKIIHPSFLTRRMVGWGTPSIRNFG